MTTTQPPVLEEYPRRRNLRRTTEPRVGRGRRGARPIFVVQKPLEKGHVVVWLEGRKLVVGYALTRIDRGGREIWLLVKMADERADPARDPVSTQPESVVSGRTVEEVAAAAQPAPARSGAR
jgi:hypothetical protein